MKKIKDARKQYEYLRNKLMKEFKRGGLTTQEEKILKLLKQSLHNYQMLKLNQMLLKLKQNLNK